VLIRLPQFGFDLGECLGPRVSRYAASLRGVQMSALHYPPASVSSTSGPAGSREAPAETGETPRYRDGTFRVQVVCCVAVVALGIESDQSGEHSKLASTACGFFAMARASSCDRGLEDCGSVAICGFGIESESLGSIDII